MHTRIRVLLLLGVECLVSIYLALMAWVLSTWMVDDGLAARMTPGGWYLIAAQRLCAVTAVSAVFTLAAWIVNTRCVHRGVTWSPRTLSWLAGGLGGAIFLAGFVGCVQFVIRKPFL